MMEITHTQTGKMMEIISDIALVQNKEFVDVQSIPEERFS